jgi:hypothetical protein
MCSGRIDSTCSNMGNPSVSRVFAMGATALTRTPYFWSSMEAVRVRPITPAAAAAV